MDTDTSTLSPNDNEPVITPSADTGDSPSAGAMLRTLREQAGMELETLGAALKVSTQRLHALESDDYSALPALYFARGLAANICRHLGQDAAPVLAKMPIDPELAKEADAGMIEVFAGDYLDNAAQTVAKLLKK